MYGEEVCFIGKQLKNSELLTILTNQIHKKKLMSCMNIEKDGRLKRCLKSLKHQGFIGKTHI